VNFCLYSTNFSNSELNKFESLIGEASKRKITVEKCNKIPKSRIDEYSFHELLRASIKFTIYNLERIFTDRLFRSFYSSSG